ncbi:hypothetical protein Q428_14995, partial [Fervidicella metallireducens AeB]
YSYDSSDNLISMNLNGVEYYYIRNGQGDIIGLFDNTGTQVVSYSYDSWGKLISTTGTLASTVGQKNPYRYRGYRFDTETGFYYLQSRYYNPEWGRFINEDAIVGNMGELLSYNMFAYCMNNPINLVDKNGYGPELALIYTIPGVGEVAAGITIIAVGTYGAYKAGVWAGNQIKKLKQSKEDKKAREEGIPRENHQVVPNKKGGRNPSIGEPNSSSDYLNPDGSVKQRRYYGPDGKPEEDIDYNHPNYDGTHKFPHRHIWDWSKNPPRQSGK